jgi:DNA repair protein RecN (Recombination protein N)
MDADDPRFGVARYGAMAYKTATMLRFLRVRHFALIDQLELHFNPGFNLLSGETGAGKSILVDALGLLAGAKASSDTIRSGEARAIVEAIFEVDLRSDLDRLGLDAEDDLIIRREISSDGRNRVYINNQPTTVAVLKELAPSILDIHGQHEQQTLLDPASQLSLIDAFAEATDLASRVRELDARIQTANSELSELLLEQARRFDRLDFLTFQRDEIQKTGPKQGEAEDARSKLDILAHASKLLETATHGYDVLYDSEASISSLLGQIQRGFRDAAQFDKRMEPLVEQTESVRIQIQDIAFALRDYSARIEADPNELERLQSRLAELERLQRKYGPDLLGHLNRVQVEMDSIGLTESRKEELGQKISELTSQYNGAAGMLSRKRRMASKALEEMVVRELKSLAMPNVRFEVQWTDVSPGRSRGLDRVEFRISANPGEEPRPLDKIASGGELSRIMLALRTVMTVEKSHKTLVFDEVDAGIGGKAAETVGKKLQDLADRYQILCVTHLAQIAAFASHQFHIEKIVRDGRTVTRIEPLEGPARVEELARMMSGTRVTDAARQHIHELLVQSGKWNK